jgi:hypothetical protein
MPRKNAKQSQDSYWEKRLGAKAFKHALADTIAGELRLLAKERVADVLDAERIRGAIREWDTRLIDRTRLADLVIQVHRHVTARLDGRQESLFDVIDRQLVADIETLLTDVTEDSARTEEFVGDLMQQEFVRSLFTDIIFTAIVSFNKKVNPFFGGLTMRVLEEQIKGFIRLFMPMLIEQATAFVVSADNQRIAVDFAREIIRQLLDQPLRNFAVAASPTQRKRVETVIRKAVTNAKLEVAIRQATIAAWDDFYSAVRNEPVGELIRLDAQASWLATQCVEALLPLLTRPGVLQLIASETLLAVTQISPRFSPKRRATAKPNDR